MKGRSPPGPPTPPRAPVVADNVVVERQLAAGHLHAAAQRVAATASNGGAEGSHGLVVGHHRVRQRDRAAVDSESGALGGQAARDREPDDIDLGIGVNREDAKIGRSRGAVRATVSFAGPGPSMSVRPVVLLRSGRAELSVIVPVTEKLIVLLPVVLSAWVMTYRRSPVVPAPVPVSPRLVTVKVESSVRASSSSTVQGRCRRRRCRLDRVDGPRPRGVLAGRPRMDER